MLLRSGEKLNSKARDSVCETRTQVLFLGPYLMVECIEWSHGYMAAGYKPSHIDDAGKVNISITIDKKWIWTHFINHIRTFILCLDS